MTLRPRRELKRSELGESTVYDYGAPNGYKYGKPTSSYENGAPDSNYEFGAPVPYQFGVYRRCFSTKNCGAGFACIGGLCVQENLSSTQTCQDQKDCLPTTATNPVTGCTEDDCTCCNGAVAVVRVEGDLTVITSCNGGGGGGDEEDEEKECDLYVNNYYEMFGELYPGATEDMICDDCEDCNGFSKCVPRARGSAPCYCEQSGCRGECAKCNEDGTCGLDCENCVREYCGLCCGQEVCVTEKACGEGRARAEQRLLKDCPNPCITDDDLCVVKRAGEDKTYCDQALPPCPEGVICTNNGFITVHTAEGDRTCFLRNERGGPEPALPDVCDLCKNAGCGEAETCDPNSGACRPAPGGKWCITNPKRFLGGSTPIQPNLGSGDDKCISMAEIEEGWTVKTLVSSWEPSSNCDSSCTEVTSAGPTPTPCSGTGGGCGVVKIDPSGNTVNMFNNGLNQCAESTFYDLNGNSYRAPSVSGAGCTITWEWEFSP